MEPTYFIEGTIYISKVNSILKQRTFCHNKTIGYEVPKWKSIEIDDNSTGWLWKQFLKIKGLRLMDKNFLITKNKTIKHAMEQINLNKHKCIVVVDKSKKMLGTLSDGDIRGAILKSF